MYSLMIPMGLSLGRIPVMPIIDARLRPIWRQMWKTYDMVFSGKDIFLPTGSFCRPAIFTLKIRKKLPDAVW